MLLRVALGFFSMAWHLTNDVRGKLEIEDALRTLRGLCKKLDNCLKAVKGRLRNALA